MAKNETIIKLSLNNPELIVDRKFNVREDKAYSSQELETLLADIGHKGQTTPIIVSEKSDGTLKTLQGNRRLTVMRIAAERGMIDPRTMKTDDDGNLIPDTGEVFSVVDAIIKKNLTPFQEVSYLLDASQTRGLNRVELFNSFVRARSVGMKEAEIQIALADLFDQHFTLPADVRAMEDGPEKLKRIKDARHGTYQKMDQAFSLPDAAQDAYRRTLNKQIDDVYIQANEVTALAKALKDDFKNDSINVSRNNPGPQYTALWDKIVRKFEEAKAAGTLGKNKPKTSAIMGANDIRNLASPSVTASRFAKLLIAVINRDIEQADFIVINKAQEDLETGAITHEAYNGILDPYAAKLRKVPAVAVESTETQTEQAA